MSGICGLFQRDGSPVDPADLQKMMNGMAHWGPDGRSQIISGSVGLGQLLLHNTPQAHQEQLPRQTASGLLLTAEARLDNRPDLYRQLNIPNTEQETITDSQLIELAYEKWGEACPDQLIGDWSFAVWHPQTQRLFLARDQYGNTSVYYYQDAARFAFASSREALLALGVPRRLNELYLAQVLISWSAYHGETSIDLDIMRLPPAHTITVTREKTAVHQYWRLEDTAELRLPNFEAYVEGFLEVFEAAVVARLRSSKPVGVTLSGGLDSGSVTALAARALHQQGKRLPAFTSVPIYDVANTVGKMRFGDETKFAQETASFHPNIDHYLLDSATISPIEGVRRILAIRNEPGHAGANFYWIADMLQTAQEQGVGTLLTGQGGNATISWTGAPDLISPLARFKYQGWKAGIKQFLPLFILRALHHRRLLANNWVNSAIQPEFARRLNLAEKMSAAVGTDISLPETYRHPRDMRYDIIKPGHSIMGTIWAEIGAGFGMEVRDPTIDKRVLSYTIAVPDAFFVAADGADRRLIRTAMRGLLPDEVRLNPKRGRQAADLGQRLANSGDEVERVLAEVSKSGATSYVDLGKLQGAWQAIQTETSLQSTTKGGTILLRGLNSAMFFLKNEELKDAR
ncbi:MAG: asparagine synthase-related protein [Chloroflexota bacterium]